MNAIPSITADPASAISQDAAKAKLKKVAQQFEGIFLQELFKGLEHQPEEGDLLGDSQASQMFNQLHHQALSDKAAGGMGIADLMYQELAAKAGIKTANNK